MKKALFIKKILFKKNVLPEQIIFFVTNRCNLRCRHCFYFSEIEKKVSEPLLEEIEKVTKNIGIFNFITITGGEPFLRGDLAEVAAMFTLNNKVKRLDIPTNGFDTERIIYLTKNILKKINEVPVFIKVSLDGLNDTHNRLRDNDNSFNNAVKTLEELLKLKKEYRNLKVGVISTINQLNENEIEKFADFILSRYPVDTFGLNLIRGNAPTANIKPVDIENYLRGYNVIFRHLCKRRENRLFSAFYSGYKSVLMKNIVEIYKKKAISLECYAGRLICVIDNFFNVRPCEVLNKTMGNLRNYDYDFKKLWYSNKANKIRYEIIKNNCMCTHECNLQINMFFNIGWLYKIFYSFLNFYLKLSLSKNQIGNMNRS